MARKTLLSIVQQVAAELNLPQPSLVVTSQDQNILKLLALTKAVCDDLLAEFDWQFLQTRSQITTMEGIENYELPSDMVRLISGTFFDETNRWPLRGPKTPGEWEWLKSGITSGAPFERFRVFNDYLWVTPAPGATPLTFNYEYITNNCFKSGMLFVNELLSDDTTIYFDHRVVVYGIKLKWLASIRQDTTQALIDYNRALEFAKGSDSPAQRLTLANCDAYPVISTANYADGSWA